MNGTLARPRVILRLEGVAALTVALVVYFHDGHPWWLLLLLVLAPDLTFLGYLAGPRVGAALYNMFHAYVGALSVLASGYLLGSAGLVAVALIWIVHIGADRALGYGLKYPTAFEHTHLQRV
jgi:uncharacterized protein DUF4260